MKALSPKFNIDRPDSHPQEQPRVELITDKCNMKLQVISNPQATCIDQSELQELRVQCTAQHLLGQQYRRHGRL